ncbi:MAG: rod shape-determining protein RodA [Acidobacteriota bacterium]|jgi:rod shape determining protein RodA|nr:rod shape-determining protein RodA [Acidobacteriota bacterium]
MASYRSLRDFDWPMLVLAFAICGLGVLQIFSATHDTGWRDAWWKQIVWVVAAFIAMWVITLIDYHTLLAQVPLLYGISIVTLVGTFILGMTVFGSRRWIGSRGFHLQVSEFVKVMLILLVARYLTELKTEQLELRDLLKLGGLVAVPMVLVIKQPDLGTALTYLPILFSGIFLAGLRWQYAVAILLIFVLVLPVGYHFLQDYQRARLVSFLDPSQDPKGSGYQVIQSKIAVGSGALWGQGVTRGSQTQGRFLPVPHTDFIFSAFAEEHGFVGVVVALGLYFLLLLQIVQNAQTAPDRAGTLICMGVATLLLFHILVNVGMVVGRMPVTGIPLPLMSSGGSNILSVFLMLGLVNNVRLRRFVN